MSPEVPAEAEQPFSEGNDADLGRWLPYGERELRVRDLEAAIEEPELVEVGPGDGVLV